jgi:hypothetical protein
LHRPDDGRNADLLHRGHDDQRLRRVDLRQRQPERVLANACNITVANVEGQKSGLIFYSITGQLIQAWNATSFLCVKAPTQRTGTQTSGGTVNACDGTLSLDWNAFQPPTRRARQPLVGGNKVQVQAWFRDPPAGKATNLSNAIEMTYVP